MGDLSGERTSLNDVYVFCFRSSLTRLALRGLHRCCLLRKTVPLVPHKFPISLVSHQLFSHSSRAFSRFFHLGTLAPLTSSTVTLTHVKDTPPGLKHCPYPWGGPGEEPTGTIELFLHFEVKRKYISR